MSIQRRGFLGLLVGAGLAGCSAVLPDRGDSEDVADGRLVLATTTSTHDTGVLDELNRAFRDRFGITVEAVARGTGAALETGRAGDADLVIVHARSLEDAFMREGFGVNRRRLMVNDFVIVGPADDPAGIADTDDVRGALAAIASSRAPFVSRGDRSGTHVRELELWEAAGIQERDGEWYQEAGQGMGEVLVQADQRGAYTIADRGTYLSMQAEIDLVVHVGRDAAGASDLLRNPYGIMAINPAVHPHVAYDLAMAYIGFVTSPAGQGIIEDFTVGGEQLFRGTALRDRPGFEQYLPTDWDREGD